jgi:NAD(P)-dependent dehydrogenase (short-subunit alcohol dehydrogenase family)
VTPSCLLLQTDLSDKCALVSGASSGFGAHFAKVLAAAGATIILGARRKNLLEALQRDIVESRGRAELMILDVTSLKSVRESVAAAAPIDILINNAGVTRSKPPLDHSEDDWDFVVDTNLKGSWLLATEVARTMKASGRGGSIVNIASILGLREGGHVSPYAIAKAGVIQMTKQLALELARYKIRVNALAPGYFDTELNHEFFKSAAGKALIDRIPQRRLGKLEDLNGPLLLLASDASQFMTGSVLTIDGGHMLSQL